MLAYLVNGPARRKIINVDSMRPIYVQRPQKTRAWFIDSLDDLSPMPRTVTYDIYHWSIWHPTQHTQHGIYVFATKMPTNKQINAIMITKSGKDFTRLAKRLIGDYNAIYKART